MSCCQRLLSKYHELVAVNGAATQLRSNQTVFSAVINRKQSSIFFRSKVLLRRHNLAFLAKTELPEHLVIIVALNVPQEEAKPHATCLSLSNGLLNKNLFLLKRKCLDSGLGNLRRAVHESTQSRAS